MRKISANYIFPITRMPLKNGIIVINNDGVIIDIIDTKGNFKETENIEFYNGILTPGFINTHCHLELSFFKNEIPEKTGIPDFILKIQNKNEINKDEIQKAIKKADNTMITNGIVAAGDISNSSNSFLVKSTSKIKYHTFVEVIGVEPLKTNTYFTNAIDLYNITLNNHLSSSLTPHAPYSVSTELIKTISDHTSQHEGILSIHNQETKSENLFFNKGEGELFETLKKIVPNFPFVKPSGKNSLHTIIDLLPKKINTILVHNTFTNKKDIKLANNYFASGYLFWSLCPRSNLFIENTLPDVNLFVEENQIITIGTDSYASNSHLSILEELKILSEYFPSIMLNDLLKWATINGAKALKLENNLGSLEIGKAPGINLIGNINFNEMKLSANSFVKSII